MMAHLKVVIAADADQFVGRKLLPRAQILDACCVPDLVVQLHAELGVFACDLNVFVEHFAASVAP